MQEKVCFYFDISDCFLEWKIVRLIWIAYYKCREESSLGRLSRDVLQFLIQFVGIPCMKMDKNNQQHCIKIKL